MVPENLGDLEALHQRGVVGFKAFMSDSGIDDFTACPTGLLAVGLKVAARLNAIVGVHAESQQMWRRAAVRVHSRGAMRDRPPPRSTRSAGCSCACEARAKAPARMSCM